MNEYHGALDCTMKPRVELILGLMRQVLQVPAPLTSIKSQRSCNDNATKACSCSIKRGLALAMQVNADDWGNRLQEMTGRRMDQLVQMKLKMRQATMNPKTARP